MKILFNVEYQTTFGESLVLNILPGEDGGKLSQHKMTTLDGCHWFVEVTKNPKPSTFIDYYYSLMHGDEEARHEWLVEPHRLEFAAQKAARYTIYDHWIDIPEDAYMYSSALTDCIMVNQREMSTPTEYQRTVRLKVRAPQIRIGEQLAIVGAGDALGNWDVNKALPMFEHEYHEWVISLDADKLPQTFEFKFVMLGIDQPVWEQGGNRSIALTSIGANEVVVYELSQVYLPVYPWKGAGTVIPIFSLRSEGSFGVGDFGDLKKMIDWVDKTNQRILQVLPINDTNMTGSWQDSYPYNAISIYALHPQYTDFRQLPEIKDEAKRTAFETLRLELNALPQIDYERMFKAKMDYLKVLFEQEWKHVKATKAYKQFFEDNRQWLVPYAEFCVNRDKYGTADFNQWPKETKKQKLKADSQHDFWCYVQFNLDQQMHAAHEYARRHRVILKGDIPIGISRDGVEAWVEPKYFNLNGQAGAPPDPFSADGQNWGFPTYNWDEMLKDGCQWWVRRFRKMAQFFDAYRIDHVLGFFRIWEIPMPAKSGLEGQFAPALGLSREEIEGYGIYGHDDLFLVDHKRSDRWHPRIAVQFQEPYQKLNDGEKYNFNRLYNDYFYRRNNQFWYQEAMKKLPRLTLCGRPGYGTRLRTLGDERVAYSLTGNPVNAKGRQGSFWTSLAQSLSLCLHHLYPRHADAPPVVGRGRGTYAGLLQYHALSWRCCSSSTARLAGQRHRQSSSDVTVLCLLSLQDWLSIDERLRLPDQNAERINIPANPRHYWRYRMHITLEQLLKEDEFNNEIKTLITQSGRK